MKKLDYLPSLDGIRAIAVLIVFASHAPVPLAKLFPGGFGVTIFFFLSGFIITTLMRVEHENTGTLNLTKFYQRRIYRIFPPLYIVLLLSLSLWYFNILESSFTIGGMASSFFHFTNYFVILGNRSVDTLLPGMGVTWSLAVEEHFYLLFPILFIFSKKRLDNRQFPALLALFCIAVLFWRLHLFVQEDFFPKRIQWGTLARIDSILFGSILALSWNPAFTKDSSQKIGLDAATLTLAFMVIVLTLFPRGHFFREVFRYSIQGVALMPIFYFAIKWSNWGLFRLLNTWGMQWLGKLSYTFYLSHRLAISVCFKYLDVNPYLNLFFAFILTNMFCLLMYFLVEQKMTVLRKRLH